MKKGIVMEQRRNYTIMMTHDGLFEKAHPIKDVDIGFEVYYEPIERRQLASIFKSKFFSVRVAALACAFLIALLPFYMIGNGNETYAYVDIDINPSIELEVDEDLDVSNITPFNDDAKVLLDKIGDLEGKNFEDAIEIIIYTSEENGLINADKNVLIGVHYLKDGKKDPIIKTIEDHFTKKPTDWEVVTVEIPKEVRATAEKNKQSMNIALANTVANQTDDQASSIVTKEDKEVLQSFFNTKKTEVDISNKKSSENGKPAIATEKENEKELGKEKIRSFKDKPHPSELKGKNGDINSNKKGNVHNNGKAKGHDKDKFNKGNGRNKGKASQGKKNVEKSNQKDKHKENDKKGKEHKGNNGKHRGHEKDHKHKGNNGNGKNKDDDYSFGFPQYK